MRTGPGQKPPPHPFYGDSYERGKDPWHVDAFKGVPGAAEAIAEGRVLNVGDDSGINSGKRSEGWFLLDGWGNAIGFVPDGTEMP